MLCHIPTQVSFAIMFLITAAYFLVELAIGYVYQSLVLQADAYHMLSDVVSLVIGFVASKISSRGAMNEKGEIKNTFGWARSEVVGALINAIFLVALCFTIVIEALMRYSDPQVTSKPMIVMGVAIGGLVLNGVGLLLFHDHAHGHTRNKSKRTSLPTASADEHVMENQELPNDSNQNNTCNFPEPLAPQENNLVEQNDIKVPVVNGLNENTHSSQMNLKGVYLHIVGDFLGSIIVIINCVVIKLAGTKKWVGYLDPSLSLISVGILLYSSVPLAKSAMKILIQTVPKGFDIITIQNELQQKFDEILDIHDFHLWQLVGSKYIATLHVKFKNFDSYINNSENIKSYFHSIGIHSLTLQPEFYQENHLEQNNIGDNTCLLACPPGSNCDFKHCCSYPTKLS